MDSLSKVLQPAFDLLWAHGIGMTSQVTDVKLSVQSVFTMQLSMCADNYGAQVTMFGGLLYCQANNISGINIALKHAQLVALPQSEEAFNTTIGIEMNVGAVVFIPDISPVASVAHLNLHVEDLMSTIATMYAACVGIGNLAPSPLPRLRSSMERCR